MLIFESEHIHVDFHDRKTDCVIVSFSERELTPQPVHRQGFGQDFVRKLGQAGMFVKCSGNDWYQYPEMPDALAEMQRALAQRLVITYGSSMGAYAALLFAGRLGAKRAVAISPQFSVDPRKMPDERRWLRDQQRISFIDDDMDIPESCTAYVLVDPFHQDFAHAREISERCQHVTLVKAPFASHPVGHFLREAGMLPQTIGSMIDGTFSYPAWARERRRSRSKSEIYRRGLNCKTRQHYAHDDTSAINVCIEKIPNAQ